MDRRNFIRGGLALIAAPAIVRLSSLMPIRVVDDALSEYQAFVREYRMALVDFEYSHDGRVWIPWRGFDALARVDIARWRLVAENSTP